MTDQDVIDLYRNLLNRDPEDANTIAAFKSYYPTLERGRRAIFLSTEFRQFYARTTGRVPDASDHIGASLALALHFPADIPRSAPNDPEPNDSELADPALRDGLAQFFRAEDRPYLAVAIGQPAGLALDDLLPLGRPQAAILHLTPATPPPQPRAGTLSDGTAIFHLAMDPGGLASLLARMGRTIDALYLLDAAATPHWFDTLRGSLSRLALFVLGPAHPGFDPAAIGAAIHSRHVIEHPTSWRGLTLHQLGGSLLPVTYAPPARLPAPPARDAHPTLAIAAIVRNEAVCVRNMLASTLPVASFYAVLDTGSTDGTQSLVQAFLAECGVPAAFAERDREDFQDDFAAMRNAALDSVPAWIDWVLMLDADEELVPEDAAALLQLLTDAATTGAESYALPRYNFSGIDKSGPLLTYPDRQVRLLRNKPDRSIRYAGAVHERILSVQHVSLAPDAHAIGASRGGPHIHHLVRRFRTAAEEDAKQARYQEIQTRHQARS